MWMPQQAGANQGPHSQPPEGRGGTMLLDAAEMGSQPDGVYGTVKLPQNWEEGQARPPSHPPVANSPDGTYVMDGMSGPNLPAGGAPITRNPASASVPPDSAGPPGSVDRSLPPDAGGDYTMFATETRSKGKTMALLIVGAVVAVAAGGLFAFVLLSDDSPDDSDKDAQVAVVDDKDEAKPSDDNSPPPEEPVVPEEEPEVPEADSAPEIPSGDDTAATPEDPPDPTGAEPETPPDSPKDPEPATTKTPRQPRQPRKPPKDTVKASLSSSDVSKGFGKARATALACKGGIPGMSIKGSATINSKGDVISAKATKNGGLPVASCVVKAVKNKAKFPKTKAPLTIKSWSYTFK
jgi:outer membrane biosynthesis protein TonB